MVRFGINGWCWAYPFYDEKQFTHAISRARRIGYDGIEIPVEDPDKLDVEKLRRTLEKFEMIPSSMTPHFPDPISSDPKIRKKSIETIRKEAEIAKQIGADSASIVFVPSAVSKLSSDQSFEEDWRLAVEVLGEIGDIAAQNNVYICIEPLNRWETYFINTVEEAVNLVKEVDHDHVKVMIDLVHMNIEENKFEPEILNAGNLIYHVHCNENNRGAPGSGHVPFKEVFSALKEIGYQRWLVIQTFKTVVKVIPRAAIPPKKRAVDQDTLAKDGLKYMEHTWYAI